MPRPPSDGTSAAVVAGASWTTLSRAGLQVFSAISMIVLAQYVKPREYGLAGMAQVVTNFAALFRDIGVSAAIIREKTLDDDLLPSIFWLTLGMSLCVTAACCLIAPFAARFFNEPALPPILQALSLCFAITALSGVQIALMNREFQFSRIAAVELLAGAAGMIAAVIAAVLGAGVWSIVTGTLTNVTVTSILYIALCPWRPTLSFSPRRLGPVLRFGLNISGFNIVSYFDRNTDNLLIGKYLHAAPLAYYNFAYNLMLYPVQMIGSTLGRVLFPAFARMQEDQERFGRAYLRACAAIAFVTFPLMAGVSALAPEVIAVILPKWHPVAPLLRILAPVGMVQSLTMTTGFIYMAMGKTGAMFRWSIISTGITVAGFAIGLHWGLPGVASSYAMVTLLTLIPAFWIPFRFIRLRVRDLWSALWPIIRAVAAMTLVTVALRRIVLGWHSSPLLALLILVPFGAASYFAIMYWRNRALLVEYFTLLRSAMDVFRR